jgi:hypothetical protein
MDFELPATGEPLSFASAKPLGQAYLEMSVGGWLSSDGGKDLVFVYRAPPVQLCHAFEGLVVLSTAVSLERYAEAGGC